MRMGGLHYGYVSSSVIVLCDWVLVVDCTRVSEYAVALRRHS